VVVAVVLSLPTSSVMAVLVVVVVEGGGGTGAVANATIRCKLFNCVDKSDDEGDDVMVLVVADLPLTFDMTYASSSSSSS
jgi:hypothetical protein